MTKIQTYNLSGLQTKTHLTLRHMTYIEDAEHVRESEWSETLGSVRGWSRQYRHKYGRSSERKPRT